MRLTVTKHTATSTSCHPELGRRKRAREGPYDAIRHYGSKWEHHGPPISSDCTEYGRSRKVSLLLSFGGQVEMSIKNLAAESLRK